MGSAGAGATGFDEEMKGGDGMDDDKPLIKEKIILTEDVDAFAAP